MVTLIRTKVVSNEKEVLRYEEDEEEKRIKIGGFSEIIHYIIPGFKLFKFIRKFQKEQKKVGTGSEEVIHGEGSLAEESIDNEARKQKSREKKPLKVKIGFLSFKLS